MRLTNTSDYSWECREAPLDERAMQQHVRALAVALNGNGRTPLCALPQGPFAARMAQARRLAEETEDVPAALEWICENGRIAENFFASQLTEKAGRKACQLPAAGGEARIVRLLSEIVRHSDALVSVGRLIDCLTAFDEVRALEMNELWAVPEALVIVLQRLFSVILDRTVQAQRDHIEAVKWADSGADLNEPRLAQRSSAFFEGALARMHEQEAAEGRARLEKWLGEKDMPPEKIRAIEHERQALDRLQLDHILASLRLVAGLDWSECFSLVSRTEKVLMRDPAGTYPKMDDDSRAMVRGRVAELALKCGTGEATVAAAAQIAAENDEGIRREICWWLATDEGTQALLVGMGLTAKNIGRLTPDPKARRYRCIVFLMGAALSVLLFRAIGWTALAAVPVIFGILSQIAGKVVLSCVRPARLLRLKEECLEKEHRTLVVMSALLSGEKRAEELAFQIETLGCLEKDENLDFLILGDLPDCAQQTSSEDEAILHAAREAIDGINRRAERKKYYLLTRKRAFAEGEGRFMAPERKRGALNDLCALLCGGENRFVESETAQSLHAREYAFMIELDAGTRMLPGTAAKLVGTLAHPVNRARYAMLAPRMETAPDNVANRFAGLFGGRGGVDSYPTAASDLWQDLAGEGNFGGKGIVDIRAFYEAMARAVLPEGQILSHDLLEGLLAGAGFIDDVTLFEGHPQSIHGWLMRLHRWTRGDWQLLPFLTRQSIDGLGRWKILANLRRSLECGGMMILLLAGLLKGSGFCLLLGVLPLLLPCFLYGFTKDMIECAGMRLSLLPYEGKTTLDAAIRTLFRLLFTKKHLLEWVTADDTERRGGRITPTTGYAAAALTLACAALNPVLLPLAALLAAVWATAVRRSEEWEKKEEGEPLDSDDRMRLLNLAGKTWRFFEENTRENGLTNDNVQLDPPRGAAERTSPTNIGLYMVGCVAAREMGLIGGEECADRLDQTLSTVERLEKWKGHLYNWYDVKSEKPLFPRYVSSVDSGNLAAALLLCAKASEGNLAVRLETAAEKMDFTALYDEKRKLFAIGLDAENGRLSESHYDLLASESRILSYTAMMLGQVPCAHFARLGRACAQVGGSGALLSWSGTMFEYLMPCLFLPLWKDTLLGESCEAVVRAQQAHRPAEGSLPWGVSESGCYAFDRQLNYQYRAFGLSEAALRGERQDNVIAPYASVLALVVDRDAALDNMVRMKDLGWEGEMGFYEAADCGRDRIPDQAEYRLVKSHMAHHQGMILAALCNALEDNRLVKLFMARPEAQALSLLLQEKRLTNVRIGARKIREEEKKRLVVRLSRPAKKKAADAHLLFGGGTFFYSSPESSFAMGKGGLLINRRTYGLDQPNQGFFIRLKTERNMLLLGSGEQEKTKIRFDAGRTVTMAEIDGIKAECALCVSPEDGAILQRLSLENTTEQAETVEVTGFFAVALAEEGDYMAHPAFRNLFVESAYEGGGTLEFRRRPRSKEEKNPVLIHMMQNAPEHSLTWETDLDRMLGRGGRMDRAGDWAETLTGTTGHPLNPCSALRADFRLNPGEKFETGFAIGLVWEEAKRAFIERHARADADRRAEELAATQNRELIRYLALPPALAMQADRAASLLVLPRKMTAEDVFPEEDRTVRDLWPLGLSGDRPMIVGFCGDESGLEAAGELRKIHEYYLECGLMCDLVLINDSQNGYDQPVRDRLTLLTAGPSAVMLDGRTLAAQDRTLLKNTASLCIDCARGGIRAALRAAPDGAAISQTPPMRMTSDPLDSKADTLSAFNGWGGFGNDGYVIEDTNTPAPWCNILCNEHFGSMVTEKGGSFSWYENSRNGRITPFDNDPLCDNPGEQLMLRFEGDVTVDIEGGAARVTHRPGESIYEGRLRGIDWQSTVFVDCEQPVKAHILRIRNSQDKPERLILEAHVEWLMGVFRPDRRFVRCGGKKGVLWARGQIGTAAFLALDGADAQGSMLKKEMTVRPGEEMCVSLLLGCAGTEEEMDALIAFMEKGDRAEKTREFWKNGLSRIEAASPDPLVNAMVNQFLPNQTVCARIWGRAGYYQPGGAFGFRDQLQDELSRLWTAPDEVRRHILRCAAHQFVSGDVQHWWHPERCGVRTHISDDLLFLPYAAARYAAETGDRSIFEEEIPFLEDEITPKGGDWYGEARVSGESASLHEHCLRAIRRAARFGEHDLLLMGTGDWNDGMNRVGSQGRGESVWLSEFMIAVIRKYLPFCTEEEAEPLREISGRLKEAIEKEAWDGKWYLRAFDDNGGKLGSSENSECRIDSLPQSWAVLAGLDHVRCECAMDSVEKLLIDKENGLIRLLTPPFDGESDPGYIVGYPPGIRENGGQYTHAACWVILALCTLGRAQEAWDAFYALMPFTHGDTKEKESRYRAEPYVLAGDIYAGDIHGGRGGWTWYTGAAGWLMQVFYDGLCGLKKRGDVVSMNALLPKDWNEISVTVRKGASVYVLTSSKTCEKARLDGEICEEGTIRITDDGANHRAVFPARSGEKTAKDAEE